MHRPVLLALILAAAPLPAPAQAVPFAVAVGNNRYAVMLARADLPSSTPAMARRTLRRIDHAAVAACGGAIDGSLHEVTRAVRASACWRAAMDSTVGRINTPLLTQAWQARP